MAANIALGLQRILFLSRMYQWFMWYSVNSCSKWSGPVLPEQSTATSKGGIELIDNNVPL